MSVTALLWAADAFADTTISSSTSAPIQTSTANNGAPDNLVINSSATLTPPGGAAVTVDSDNTVSNSGTIKIQDHDNATGILVLGGHTGGVTNAGAIFVNETTTAADTNGDGVPDGPFATGSNRFGIRLTGPQPFTGDISNATAGGITVQGENSAGIALDSELIGNLTSAGSVTLTGDNSVGIRTQSVTGDVTLSGGVTAAGQNAQAVSIGGDVGGKVLISGVITATGYRQPVRSTDPAAVAKLLPSDLLQGGPTVAVAGNVGSGVLVDTTGALSANSAAPALQIGAVGRDVTLGDVGAGADAFGLEVRGSVTGAGVYDGVSGTGLQVGGPGFGAVNTGGGVHVTGSVTASASVGDTTAVVFGPGAVTPWLLNEGSITSTVTNASGNTARGVLIQAGANVTAFTTAKAVSAVVSGTSGEAIAIQDLSGTLTSLQNNSVISAVLTSASGPAASGRAIAIDDSANTVGLHLAQVDTSNGATPPSITGAILFGSGDDRADIGGGSITGDLAFGAGANALTLTGGAAVTGGLSATGGTLALRISSGALTITSTNAVNLTSLDVASGSSLTFTADPKAGEATQLDVAGPASLADGAKIGLRVNSLFQGSQTFTLIRASQLTAGSIDTTLLGSLPYLYKASLGVDPAQGTLAVTVAEKSASELGISDAAAPALNPVLTAVGQTPALENAFLAQSTQSGFLAAFNQLLPSRSSAIFELMAADSAAVGRAIDDRESASGGAWIQEINYGAIDRGRDGLPGYHAWGVGLTGGYEAALAPEAIVGLTVGASSGQIRELSQPETTKETVDLLQAGLYWRATAGRFDADARVGGDYLHMSSDRAVAIVDPIQDAFAATASSRWNGLGLNGRIRAAYEGQLGPMFLRPQIGATYDELHEDAHTESGGGPGVDLAVDARTSSRFTGFAGVAIGKVFGHQASWGPELLVGYKNVFNENLGETTARFVSGGDPFTLAAEKINGQGLLAHLALKGENGYGGFVIEGGADTRDGLTVYDVRLAAHLQF
ncbi:MAG: autotransporter domain-containing protein [Alphaproteobacteria bacterium]|nr:autotransporter domain-containing protein [Alphaproteobacteria bacterium]